MFDPLTCRIGDFAGYAPATRREAEPAYGPTFWHILVTEPSREKSTAARLQDLELEPYLPLIHKTIPAGRRRRREIETPMFPCYLFLPLQLSPSLWRLVRGTRGVEDFMLVDLQRPAILPEEAIEAIRWVERGLDAKRLQRLTLAGEAPFKVRDRVWVKDMLPFTTMLANVAGFDARGRVEVLLEVEIFGRKNWAIEPHLLQLVDA